jgi:hypothetical protein
MPAERRVFCWKGGENIMSERLIGIGDVERGSHWCTEYQALQRQLSALEAEAERTVIPGMPEELGPEIWEARTGYWDTEDRVEMLRTAELDAAVSALNEHLVSCEPCIAHFS